MRAFRSALMLGASVCSSGVTLAQTARQVPALLPTGTVTAITPSEPRPVPQPEKPLVGPPPIQLRTAVPAGFDDLAGPVDTLFDVIYLNRRIGSFRAIVTGGYIRFADPDDIVAAIGTSIDPAGVKALLSQSLPLNADRLCQGESGGCGFLPVGASGLIVDTDRFTSTIFLGRQYIVASEEAVEPLGDPTSGPSLVQNMLMSVSATTNAGDSVRYGGTFDSYASIGRNAAIAQNVLDDSNGLRLQSGYVQHIWNRQVAAAGLFANFDSLLLNSYRLAGAQFHSLDRTRNVDNQMASPVEIVLPRSATVELSRDGVLLSSRRYAAGLQLLDTQNLPTGAYSIRLVARDGGTIIVDETRSFVKVAELPAPGEVRFALRAGMRVDDSYTRSLDNSSGSYLPEMLNQPVAQAQAAFRVSAASAVTASLLTIDSKFYGEGSYSAFMGRIRATVAAAGGNDGSYGGFVTGTWTSPSVSVNLTGRTVHSDNDQNFLPGGTRNRQDYAALLRSEDSVQGSVQFQLLGGSLNVSGSYTRSPFLDDRKTVTTRYTRQVRFGGLGVGLVGAYALVSNIEQRVGISFSFQSRIDARTNVSYGGGGEYVGKSSGSLRKGFSPAARAVATRRDRIGIVDVTSQAGFITDASSDRVFTNTAANSSLGSADVGLQFEHGTAGRSYGSLQLNAQSGFVIGGGAVKLGLRQPGEAFALVDIDADTKRGEKSTGGYRVIVDGQPYDYVPANSTAAVGLEALSNYRVGLEPENAPPYEIDLGERHITLYPGNVVRLKFKAERSVTVFGQVIGSDGKPIGRARIRAGSDLTSADDSGYFTLSGTAATRMEIRRPDGTDCLSRVIGDLVTADHKNVVERLGAIRCDGAGGKSVVPVPAKGAETGWREAVSALQKMARADLDALDRAMGRRV